MEVGFPKSMDISKQIDKKGGNDYSKQFSKDLKQARKSRNLTMKYCDDKYCNGSTNWSWYEGRKDGCRVPDYNTYLEIVKDFPELEKYRELIKEAEREVIGIKKNVGCFDNTNHYTIGGTTHNDYDITAPSTDLAKQWQGWGTALKPSFEPIIVARKPFKGSLVDNVIEYGVGGINIDECRVGNETISIHNAPKGTFAGGEHGRGSDTSSYRDSIGRFPANTILTYDETDFEEVCGGFPNKNRPNESICNTGQAYKDSGSASRYFYNAKASKRDRDCDGTINNIHPTCKPCTLMQYLVRLVTPKGGIILDPFMGSGSTGKAVMFENKERQANYSFIGIEKEKEYCDIARARIEWAKNLKEDKQEDNQIHIDELGGLI